jgi:trimeric autotransporter adhesin
MRRFVTLAVLLLFSIPFGISVSGCSKGTPVVYCNGGSSGPIVGQPFAITLQPRIFGISLNYAQIGQVSAPSATDCKGSAATISTYTYGIFNASGQADLTIADIDPANGKLCAGSWNRNSSGGVADFTTCTPNNKTGEVFVVATGGGVSSNPLPIFIHPVVTGVVLGNPTPQANCSTDPLTDPSSNCCPLATQAVVTAPLYQAGACLSQGSTGQLAARVYRNATTNPADNITCQVGHLTYTAQTSGVVSIDENGVATAQAPGSTIINASLSNAASSAGFFSTCPPTSIQLSVPNVSGTPGVTSVVVNQNNTQPITSVVTDKNGTVLTGLSLEFVSTAPTTIPPASAGTVTPLFPGAASITAICLPPSCNSSSFNQIGLFGNGKPITSNPISVTTPGQNSTLLYIASTKSRYMVPIDFVTNAPPQPLKLPFVPNSMVISNDGSSIYMGSANEIMVVNALTNAVSREDATVKGIVLAISPDGTTLVVTDPTLGQTYLYAASTGSTSGSAGASAGGIVSTYGGVATHASFSPDSQTVYITTGTVVSQADPVTLTPAVITPTNQMLVHATFTGWTAVPLTTPASDVSVTVPSVGAYLAGATTTGRSYCPSTTISADGNSTTNEFYPLADTAIVPTDRVIATSDGLHILGATVAGGVSLSDLGFSQTAPKGLPIGACPQTVAPNFFTASRTSTTTIPLGVSATAITGIVPTPDSTVAIVTYTGSGSLPAYHPATGAITPVALTGSATAPVSGVASADDTTFFVGTSGDKAVHLISTSTLTDNAKQTIVPSLPAFIPAPNGPTGAGTDNPSTTVTPDLLVQRPRRPTA